MKRLVFSVLLILFCVCVISVVLTEKPLGFATLVYLVNNSPSFSITASNFVNSTVIPYILDSWNFTVINLNPVRDFFNNCVTAINVVWRPISYFCSGFKYIIDWWSFFFTYFFS